MPLDIPIRKIDHVRFFVGNARQSAFFYRNAFGFDVVAYAGLETKVRHEAGYVLKQGGITFVLVSPLRPQHPDVQRLVLHGDVPEADLNRASSAGQTIWLRNGQAVDGQLYDISGTSPLKITLKTASGDR